MLDRGQHLVGEFADAIFRDARDIDATVVDHIDAVLGLELLDHVARQPEQREHPRMLGDEVEILAVRALADRFCQFDAQTLHPFPHFLELGGPLGAQLLVLEDDADDLGAMVRRLQIVPRMTFCIWLETTSAVAASLAIAIATPARSR